MVGQIFLVQKNWDSIFRPGGLGVFRPSMLPRPDARIMRFIFFIYIYYSISNSRI